ncbi:MAG: hypothetical protein K2I23_01920 [Clostridia bacterium]|nr:hypothetical protein [Clostridia bacterium]
MGLFKKKPTEYATLSLNMRLRPIDRGSYYEDILNKILKKGKIGVVDGGGTEFTKEEGPLGCDVNIDYYKDKEESLIELLKQFPTSKGSKLILMGENEERSFDIGNLEGMAVYLNGVDLDKEVYETCSADVVFNEMSKLIGKDLVVFSWWQGNRETALYFYGANYERMKSAIEPFIATYPLCQKCRIEQLV